jgi:multimeric flavodoxin WrbA
LSLFIIPATAIHQRVAQQVAAGANAELIAIDAEGNVPDSAWDQLAAADAIIFGAPTYMGSPSWQFKKFADATSKAWFTRAWQDKVFGGFTNSASLNGDKQAPDYPANPGVAAWRHLGQPGPAAEQHQGRPAYRHQQLGGVARLACWCNPRPMPAWMKSRRATWTLPSNTAHV